jgi:hypothetical protein
MYINSCSKDGRQTGREGEGHPDVGTSRHLRGIEAKVVAVPDGHIGEFLIHDDQQLEVLVTQSALHQEGTWTALPDQTISGFVGSVIFDLLLFRCCQMFDAVYGNRFLPAQGRDL